MSKPFVPSSSELLRQVAAAEAKCDGDREQAALRAAAHPCTAIGGRADSRCWDYRFMGAPHYCPGCKHLRGVN